MKDQLITLLKSPQTLTNDEVSPRYDQKTYFLVKCPKIPKYGNLVPDPRKANFFEKKLVLNESIAHCASKEPSNTYQ